MFSLEARFAGRIAASMPARMATPTKTASVRTRGAGHTREPAKRNTCKSPKADARTRTGDPFITSEVLYQLSYVGGAFTVAGLRQRERPRRGLNRAVDRIWTGLLGRAWRFDW
jgi:hypothetical protein